MTRIQIGNLRRKVVLCTRLIVINNVVDLRPVFGYRRKIRHSTYAITGPEVDFM